MSRDSILRCFLPLAILPGIATLPAQDESVSRQGDVQPSASVTQIYWARHANAQEMAHVLRHSGPTITSDSALRAVVLSGNPDQVAATLKLLGELDQPVAEPVPTNVVIDLHLVGAYRDEQQSQAMPAHIEGAVDAIQKTFPFVSYRLLEAFTIRTAPGPVALVEGYFGSEKAVRYLFQIGIEGDRLQPDSIRLSHIELRLQVIREGSIEETQISTNLNTREGKTVVVGKAGIRGIADGVFLVLTARLD